MNIELHSLIIMAVLLLCVGFFNGLMDSIAHHDVLGGDKFWGLSAWRNKYKNGDPAQGQRFWGSTTFFVCFMDGWHLCKELMIVCLCMAIVMPTNFIELLYLIAARFIFYIGFKVMYR